VSSFKRLLLVLAIGALMEAVRTIEPGDRLGVRSGALVLAVGFVLLAAWFVGRLASSIGLPKLTGYLATGIVAGPTVLGYLSEDSVHELGLVNGMAVSLIMLTAGSEMDFRALRPLLRSIAWVSLIGVLGTALLLAIAIFAMRGLLPFFAGLSTVQALAVSIVLGVVLVPQSPAVVVALRAETGADGPVARTALGVVVLANVILIPIFAIASTLANAAISGSLDPSETVRQLSWAILGSLAVGAAVGGILAAWQRFVGSSGLDLFVLAACFVSAEVGRRLELDPQLLMLAAGMAVENAARRGEALRQAYADASLPVYILFFTVTGASIHLSELPHVAVPAAVIVVVRAAGLMSGGWLGARAAGAPPEVQRLVGFGLLPQAGLAIAFALLFARTFPGIGEPAAALALGVISVNELIAPALWRQALLRSGEAQAQRASSAGEVPSPEASATVSEATPPGASLAPGGSLAGDVTLGGASTDAASPEGTGGATG
jgi:Kef-type K+ transport system membrane component KefB